MASPSMKNSFSLSSLPPSTPNVETPEQVRIRERPYNSLTKKPRKNEEKENWRKSWDSQSGKIGDDFTANYNFKLSACCTKNEEKENWRKSWDSQSGKIGDDFTANYNYLMNTHLIDSCQSITDGKSHSNQSGKLVQISPESYPLADNSFTYNVLDPNKRIKPFHNNRLDLHDLYLNIEHKIKGLIYCMDCIETKLPPVNLRKRWKRHELTKEDLGRRKLKHERELDIEHKIKGLIYCMDCIETKLPPVNLRKRWKRHELTKEDLVISFVSFSDIEHKIKGLIYCMDCIETKLPPVNLRKRWKRHELTKEDLGRRKLKHE
ncbi:uncharacterized protein LOC103514408, partial [Diaphorina citri]|uniref:Uncharacterized protein LOC103514408 n=1 Tax=Diaphorina citri TaxID=121845 RepID=A0A3Q0J899_DIACI